MDYERLIQLKNAENLYKGIILEIHPAYLHVLTDEGEHLKLTHKKGHKIGEVIYFLKEDLLAQDRPNAVIPIKSKMRYLSMVAAILLIVFMVNTSLLNVTYAVLSLDINPSVEMTLNRNGQVLKVLGLNEDATHLLSGIDLKGEKYNVAIDEILKQAKALGYSIDQRSVLIAVAPLKSDSNQMVEAIQKNISKYAETIDAEILVGDKEDYEEISEDQISLGRHLLSIEHPDHDEDIKTLEIHDLFERLDEDDAPSTDHNEESNEHDKEDDFDESNQEEYHKNDKHEVEQDHQKEDVEDNHDPDDNSQEESNNVHTQQENQAQDEDKKDTDKGHDDEEHDDEEHDDNEHETDR